MKILKNPKYNKTTTILYCTITMYNVLDVLNTIKGTFDLKI